VYDTLLFLHLLSAFIAFITIAIFGAYVLGAPMGNAGQRIADISWSVSGAGLLIFGIWLALYVDGYEIWDGWILGALVLFGAASAFGAWAQKGITATMGEAGGEAPSMGRVAAWHWLRTLSVIVILVLMIWKPGA
jgi:hypothetical protein